MATVTVGRYGTHSALILRDGTTQITVALAAGQAYMLSKALRSEPHYLPDGDVAQVEGVTVEEVDIQDFSGPVIATHTVTAVKAHDPRRGRIIDGVQYVGDFE